MRCGDLAKAEMNLRWKLIMKYGPVLYEILNDRIERRARGEKVTIVKVNKNRDSTVGRVAD